MLLFGFVVAVAFGVVLGTILYFSSLSIRSLIFSAVLTAKRISLAKQSSEVLTQELDKDFVTNIVRITLTNIRLYYEQTKIQAEKSFTFAVFASITSLILILVGIGLSFSKERIAPTTVAAVAGVLGQFISAVFFYLYNQTITKMADYHRKLVFTQNIALSLRIAEDLADEDKSKARKELIDKLMEDMNQHLAA